MTAFLLQFKNNINTID